MADYHDKIPDEADALIERVADHLREPEHLDTSFDARLMERVRAEARSLNPGKIAGAPSWWRRPRVVRLSPIGAIALAASVSMLVVLSTLAVGSRIWNRSDKTSASRIASIHAASDTVNLIRFVFVDANASSVQLVGDFNEWTRGATQLKPSGAPGVWAVAVALPAGRHEYAFIVDGKRWIADPLATKSSDDFGTESSVIQVGSGPQRST